MTKIFSPFPSEKYGYATPRIPLITPMVQMPQVGRELFGDIRGICLEGNVLHS